MSAKMAVINGKSPFFTLASNPSLEAQDPEWRQCIANGLTRLWQSQDLCDYTLVAEGHSFHVHRVVLASVSDYFYAMLTSGMKETQQDHVELKAINAGMLKLLLDYAYTGILHITADNVIDLLNSAAHLQISTAIKACLSFMNDNISVDNCVEILDIARLHLADRDYSNKFEDFVAENLGSLIESGNYLKLSFESMNGLLCREELMFGPEEKLYQAVVQWLEHDPENRMQFHICLMEHIRFPLMTVSEIDTIIETRSELMLNPVLHTNIKQAQEYLSKPVHQRVLCQNSHTRLRMKPCLFAIREGNDQCAFSTDKGKWYNVRSLDFEDLFRASCVVVNDFMLMCGGGNNGEETRNTCYIFDPREYKWTELAPMCVPRRCFGLVEHKGFAYALGGYNSDEDFADTLERYSFETNQWELFARMYLEWDPMPRFSACVVYNRIYTGQGHNGDDYEYWEILNRLASLDIGTKTWEIAPFGQEQLHGSYMWFQGDLIYAVDHLDSSPTIHWYDPKTGDTGLVFCPEPLISNARIVTHNKKLYFIDGTSREPQTHGLKACREVVIKDKSVLAIKHLPPTPDDDEILTMYCLPLRLPWHEFIFNEEDMEQSIND